MEASGYTTLTRQTGLLREMRMVANNIANAATTGYRSEGLLFSEHVRRTDGGPSLSMARGNTPLTSREQGPLEETGGRFDFAIEGDGYFLIETPEGERLTRSGAFSLSAAGDLVNADGFRLLDAGGAPVFVPPDATAPGLAADGTLSSDGRPLAQLGLYRPAGDGPPIRPARGRRASDPRRRQSPRGPGRDRAGRRRPDHPGLSRGIQCRAGQRDRAADRGAARL